MQNNMRFTENVDLALQHAGSVALQYGSYAIDSEHILFGLCSIKDSVACKILNNYGTYIQVLGNGFCFKDYQVLKLDSFTDMLEIRDTIRQPILMRENYQKDSAYFVIPGDTKILYVYRLNVEAIKKEIKK